MVQRIHDVFALVGGLLMAVLLAGALYLLLANDVETPEKVPYDQIERINFPLDHPGGRFITPYIFEFCDHDRRPAKRVRWWSNGMIEPTSIECFR